ncbi:PAS domain S-box protein, partial [bacterium]
MWLLAGFGIAHGVNEWLDLLSHVNRAPTGMLKYPRSALLFLSFIIFFEFGRRLINLKQKNLIRGWITVFISLLTAMLIFFIREGVNVWPRYFLCLPGGFLIAAGTISYYQNNKNILSTIAVKKYFYSFAIVVFAYGVLGGLVVSDAGIFPANLINNSWFMARTGFPVQFFRALCAIIMSWSVWHMLGIFNWETSEKLKKNLNEMNSIKAYLDNIIKSIPDSLIVFDADCKIKMVNNVACSLLGYSEKELISMPIEHLLIKQKVGEIIEEIEDSAFLVSKDFKIIKANTVFLDKMLVRPEDVIGKYCYTATHHIDHVCQLPNDRCPIQELSYTNRPSVAMHAHFTPEGTRKLVNVIAAPVRDDKGNILYYLHISRDYGVSPDEQCLSPGSAGFEFLCNELKGFVDRLEVSTGLLKETREKVAMLMNLKNFETYFHAKSKVAIPVELSNSSITTDSGDLLGFVCIAKDIRTKKELRNIAEEVLVAKGVAIAERNKAGEVEKLYAELGKSYKKLRVAQSSLIEAEKLHSVGTLAAGVAHEVKNPLAVIFQGVDYLNANLRSDNKNIKLMLTYIEDAARKADSIIRDLLDFSRLSKPELKLSQINPVIEKSL